MRADRGVGVSRRMTATAQVEAAAAARAERERMADKWPGSDDAKRTCLRNAAGEELVEPDPRLVRQIQVKYSLKYSRYTPEEEDYVCAQLSHGSHPGLLTRAQAQHKFFLSAHTLTTMVASRRRRANAAENSPAASDDDALPTADPLVLLGAEAVENAAAEIEEHAVAGHGFPGGLEGLDRSAPDYFGRYELEIRSLQSVKNLYGEMVRCGMPRAAVKKLYLAMRRGGKFRTLIGAILGHLTGVERQKRLITCREWLDDVLMAMLEMEAGEPSAAVFHCTIVLVSADVLQGHRMGDYQSLEAWGTVSRATTTVGNPSPEPCVVIFV